uniref:Uncharacterized protein n=1 Tax=Lygus hesperus TaxID=30085 RepID=A0A146LEM7_LYGHE
MLNGLSLKIFSVYLHVFCFYSRLHICCGFRSGLFYWIICNKAILILESLGRVNKPLRIMWGTTFIAPPTMQREVMANEKGARIRGCTRRKAVTDRTPDPATPVRLPVQCTECPQKSKHTHTQQGSRTEHSSAERSAEQGVFKVSKVFTLHWR